MPAGEDYHKMKPKVLSFRYGQYDTLVDYRSADNRRLTIGRLLLKTYFAV